MISRVVIAICVLFIIAVIVLILVMNRQSREKNTDYFSFTNHKNLKIGPFIVKPNIKSTNFRDIIKPEHTSQKLYVYNPSIAYDKNGEIIGVSRLTGKIASECSYYNESDFTKNDMIDREISQYKKEYNKDLSTVIIWRLNELPKFSVVPLFSSQNICENSEFLETSQGVEDPRLFTFNGELYIYGHFRGYLDECTHSPIILKVSEPFNIKNILKLRTPNMRYIEKNWMPFEYKNELYFIYEIFPHIILKCNTQTGNCQPVYETNNTIYHPLTKKHVGGGAPPVTIYIKNVPYFLTLSHTRENKPVITRKNFFYVFRSYPPFDIVMIGPEFNIMEDYRAIEFGSGLLMSKDGKNVIISAGISDCYSVISEYPLKEVLDDMRHVGVLDNYNSARQIGH